MAKLMIETGAESDTDSRYADCVQTVAHFGLPYKWMIDEVTGLLVLEVTTDGVAGRTVADLMDQLELVAESVTAEQ